MNVLGGYAAHDYRANSIKQRRLVSEFPLLLSGTAFAGLMNNSLATRKWSAIAERMNCHRFSFRKEVIQPQVLLRLPCYDFTPIMNYTLGGCSLAVSSPTSSTASFRDVTGGVYKARERIHRSLLICDY